MTRELLTKIDKVLQNGLTAKETAIILNDIGVCGIDEAAVRGFRLWGDFLPRGYDTPYTEEQRCLHILWECLDRSPWAINIPFAIPFRAMIAKKLFRRCGEGFVANEGCRFNYGHLIEVGDNVSWNHGCYVDSKGGVSFGNFSVMTEYVKIFTHGHSEGDHEERTYKRVEIGDYAKIYTASTILPDVKIGKGAIVATGAIVTKDVDDFTLVAGIPAKPLRDRQSKDVSEYNQYMFADGLYQKKDK